MTTIEKVLYLQDLDFFRFASTEHLASLAAACRELDVPAGQILFHKGEPCSKLYFLLHGRIGLESETGQQQREEKSSLDLWPFLAEGSHTSTARALERCTLLEISFEEIVDLLTTEPEFCWAVLKYLARLALGT